MSDNLTIWKLISAVISETYIMLRNIKRVKSGTKQRYSFEQRSTWMDHLLALPKRQRNACSEQNAFTCWPVPITLPLNRDPVRSTEFSEYFLQTTNILVIYTSLARWNSADILNNTDMENKRNNTYCSSYNTFQCTNQQYLQWICCSNTNSMVL